MAGIVWLASYPRSGNTWLRLLIHSVVRDREDIDINALEGFLGHGSARQLFDETACVEASELSLELVEMARPRIYEVIAREAEEQLYLKVHEAYTFISTGDPLFPLSATAGVVYIVRDPRDVAISVAAFLAGSVDRAISILNNRETSIARSTSKIFDVFSQSLFTWSGHVESWLSVQGLRLYLLRYEDLVADPVTSFAAVAEFLGLTKSAAAIERAVRATRFETLQAQEIARGFKERPRQATSPFFRRGIAGGWRDVLTPEQVARIEHAHGPMMRRLGYL